MLQVKILYVRNLMLTTTEETLENIFNQASGKDNSVERVKKIRDYAFVHFRDRDSALTARNVLDGEHKIYRYIVLFRKYIYWGFSSFV